MLSLSRLGIANIDPKIKRELLEFCSELEQKEFPEAVLISSGKSRTIEGLFTIYEKLLQHKKDKKSQKRLKKAQSMILSISRLHIGEGITTHAQRQTIGPERTTVRPNVALDENLTRRIIGAQVIEQIERKIKEAKALTIDEAIDFVTAKYEEQLEKKARFAKEAKKGSKSVRIIMCSDARNTLGEIEFDGNIKVDSRAGNADEGKKIEEEIIVVVGHRGYKGCGAVNGACSAHNHKQKNGPLASITTDVIPEQIARFSSPNEAAYENVRYQVDQFRKSNPGKEVIGICSDVENKTAVLVSGKSQELTKRIIDSITENLVGTGDMSKQTAGFVIATRNDRASGKHTLGLSPNQGFAVSYSVNGDNVDVSRSAIDSITFALTNVGSVNKGKIIVVMDEQANVASAAARECAAGTDAFVLPMKAVDGKLEILLSQKDLDKMREAQLKSIREGVQ